MIGRFVVLGPHPFEGLGSLLLAYDPQLERKVALMPVTGGATLFEARLSHPHVLAVHEVGADHVVLEHVTGTPLRAWLTAARRSWREVLDLLAQAGSGLAAAHRAGFAHGAFGLDRVLVADDGRPRVMGFTGEGTGDDDQRAYCAAFWEAVHGERPVAGARVPLRRKAPVWLYRILVRGLAARPEERWPSLDALLAELRRRPRRDGLLAVAGTIAAVATAAFLAGRAPEAAVCGRAAGRMAEVWSPARRDALRSVFRATGLAYADATWRAASERLDGYARGWIAAHTASCRATRIEHRQADAVMDLRMECLERRRAALGALAGVWERGMDAEGVTAAVEATGALPPLAACADGRTAATVAAPAGPAVAAARRAIDEVRALMLARRLVGAKAALPEMLALAAAAHWPEVDAEAAFVQADLLALSHEAGGAAAFLEASRLAGVAHDDALAAEAMVKLVISLAQAGGAAGTALLVADLAAPLVKRAGDRAGLRFELVRNRAIALRNAGRLLEAAALLEDANRRAATELGPLQIETIWLQTSLAQVVSSLGHYARARDLFMQLLAISLPVLGADHPQIAVLYSLLGIATGRGGDPVAACTLLGRAVDIRRRVFGPDANVTLSAENDLAVFEGSRDRNAEAIALFEHVRAVRERTLGPEHLKVVMVVDNIAVNLLALGRAGEALALHLRALAVLEKALGEHVDTAETLANIGRAYEQLAEPARALEHHRRALAMRRKLLGPDHPTTLRGATGVASALASLGRCGEARGLLELPALETKLGPESEAVLEALVVRARCDLADGKPRDARGALERVVALADKIGWQRGHRGEARFLLARTLWSLGLRGDALAAAREAAAELVGANEQRELHAWLAIRAPDVAATRPTSRAR